MARSQSRRRSFSIRSISEKRDSGPPQPDSSHHDARRDSIMRGDSKANPNAAMQEAQPQLKSMLEDTTLPSLRGSAIKDRDGNIITDPDLSNPTRPRLERPLETILSFERAIDGSDTDLPDFRKSTSTHAVYDMTARFTNSRRSSSNFGTFPAGLGVRSRYSFNGNMDYYENGSFNNMSGYNSPGPGWQTPGGGYQTPGRMTPGGMRYSQRPRSALPRSYSEQHFGHGNFRASMQPPQMQNFNNTSHDTVETGTSSDSSAQINYSTDPSSENSSLDRANAAMKPQTPDDLNNYAYDVVNNHTISEEQAYEPRSPGMRGFGPPNTDYNYRMSSALPNMPPPQADVPRRLIRLGNAAPALEAQEGQLPPPAARVAVPEKRRSWLKRSFSRRA